MGVLTMEVFSNENSLDNMTVADNTDDTTGETKGQTILFLHKKKLCPYIMAVKTEDIENCR